MSLQADKIFHEDNLQAAEKLLAHAQGARILQGQELFDMPYWAGKEDFGRCPTMWFWAYDAPSVSYPHSMYVSQPYWTKIDAESHLNLFRREQQAVIAQSRQALVELDKRHEPVLQGDALKGTIRVRMTRVNSNGSWRGNLSLMEDGRIRTVFGLYKIEQDGDKLFLTDADDKKIWQIGADDYERLLQKVSEQ